MLRPLFGSRFHATDREHSPSPSQGGLDRIRQPLPDFVSNRQTVYDGFDRVRIGFGKLWRIRRAQLDDLSVDPQAHKTFAPGLFDHIAKFSHLVLTSGARSMSLVPFG